MGRLSLARCGAVVVALAAVVCVWGLQGRLEAAPAPWAPPSDPADVPLPRSARLGAGGARTAKSMAASERQTVTGVTPALREVALGVTEVLAGRHRDGAARLAAVQGRSGTLADVAAYYQGLGFYLAGDPGAALAALRGLASRPVSAFLGHDAQYLALESAARLGDHAAALAQAEAWLVDAEPALAPEVWLRAAVAAQGLRQAAKTRDYLRHLSLTWPWTKAAAAGDALARSVRDAEKGNASPDHVVAVYDPDTPGNVLLRAEAMVERGHPGEALALLGGKIAFDAGQTARAAYIRGKALYRQRKARSAAEAFEQAIAAEPASSLAGWARYHEARCLWRSLEPEDAARMEALLRQVLASPVRDDPLREVAARHLALLLTERGRLTDALAAAGTLRGLAVSPRLAAQGASLAAILRFAVGDMAGAETEMAAFVTRFPQDDWADGARYWRGKALLALGRTDEAAKVFIDAASRRPNTYYGGKAAAALAAMKPTSGQPLASPVRESPRCPGHLEAASPEAQAVLTLAGTLRGAGLPGLAEVLLEWATAANPDRADLAMAHIEAAAAGGRRGALMRTAWRTFGGCILRGRPEDLAPLRQALFPRAYAPQVREALAGSDINPDTIYSLIRQESFFDPDVVSGAGAVGLMQLMPDTGRAVGRRLGMRVSRADLFDPAVNIRLGVTYFRERLERAGSLAAALSGYNAGQTRTALWTNHLGALGEELFIELIPYTETRNYVRRIMANAMMYARLYGKELR